LGHDLDGRADGRDAPDLLDADIRDGDASSGPVAGEPLAEPEAGRLAVDEDLSSRIDTLRRGAGDVVGLGIVDAEGQVVLARVVPQIDVEGSLGRAAIALPGLVALGRETQAHGIDPHRAAILDQREAAVGLVDHDAVHRPLEGRERAGRRAVPQGSERDPDGDEERHPADPSRDVTARP
jgi:hypothetical protein